MDHQGSASPERGMLPAMFEISGRRALLVYHKAMMVLTLRRRKSRASKCQLSCSTITSRPGQKTRTLQRPPLSEIYRYWAIATLEAYERTRLRRNKRATRAHRIIRHCGPEVWFIHSLRCYTVPASMNSDST